MSDDAAQMSVRPMHRFKLLQQTQAFRFELRRADCLFLNHGSIFACDQPDDQYDPRMRREMNFTLWLSFIWARYTLRLLWLCFLLHLLQWR